VKTTLKIFIFVSWTLCQKEEFWVDFYPLKVQEELGIDFPMGRDIYEGKRGCAQGMNFCHLVRFKPGRGDVQDMVLAV